MNSSKKAIVIGGGPAGLVAAARLAEGGIATTLLEASSRLGGRAASERRDGFDLNQGPHALYAGGPADQHLRSLGVNLARWNPTSHRSVFVHGDRLRRMPPGAAALGLAMGGLLRRRPDELAGRSAAELIRQTLRGERARESAAAFVRLGTFVADLDALSADVAARQLRLLLYPGVRYLRGGWQSLVDALATKASEEGAVLRTRAAARAARRLADGWEVRLDGETLHADLLLVAAGGPSAFAKLLGERCPAAPGPSAEVSALDLGLRGLPREGRRFALQVDGPTYLSRHSPPRHRGGALLSLASYARQPREALEAMADKVQPGWRERVVMQRFLPRMVAVSAIASPGSGLAGRPGVDRGDGLYLAGDWLGDEGWLVDAAICSGAGAAAAALRGAANGAR